MTLGAYNPVQQKTASSSSQENKPKGKTGKDMVEIVSIQEMREGQWGEREFLVKREGLEGSVWVPEDVVKPALVRAFLLTHKEYLGNQVVSGNHVPAASSGNPQSSSPPAYSQVTYRHDPPSPSTNDHAGDNE